MDCSGSDGASPVTGVTVISDLLRPDGAGEPGGADRTTAWLFDVIKRQVGMAAGLAVELLTPCSVPGLRDWIARLRPPGEADAMWAASYAALPPDAAWSAAIERFVAARLHGRFCVGYELPPYLVRLLDRHRIAYVDVRLHPVRFMDDLMFAVRASNPATQALLAGLAVPETEVIVTAGLREAMCRLISRPNFPHDTLVVIGQRRFDSSQIVEGGFFDAAPHLDEIAAICRNHPAVLLKPHPHDREHSLLAAAAAVGGTVLGCVTDNIYRLLAVPEVTSVLTVSSSAAYEARYFGKTVHTLIKLPLRLGWRGGSLPQDAHASMDDVMLSVDFWRDVLAPHASVSPRDGLRLTAKPNRLRLALDSFWNYNEIDTDRLPSRAA